MQYFLQLVVIGCTNGTICIFDHLGNLIQNGKYKKVAYLTIRLFIYIQSNLVGISFASVSSTLVQSTNLESRMTAILSLAVVTMGS